MITIKENTDQRLTVTDAQHLGYGAVLILLLFGEVFLVGAASSLGGFGAIMAALWTVGLVFFISQYKWTHAIFDAQSQTLQAKMRWIYGRQRAATHNLRDIDHALWEEISLWAELATSQDKAQDVKRNLIVRKGSGFAPPQRDYDHLSPKPGKYRESEAEKVIDDWLRTHASKADG